jgi:hypothetical protein
MTPAQRTACGVTAYPLVSATLVTTGPTAGATVYVYDTEGGTTTDVVPPASFDAASASPAQLQAYGIPPEPAASDTAAHALWETMVHNLKFVTPPAMMYGTSVTSVAARSTATPVKPAACPASGRLPVNSWPATRSRLLPSGAVALRVCRYTTGAGHRLALRGSDLLTSSTQIARDTRILDVLPRAHGTVGCPVDNGSEVLLLAAYESGRRAGVSFGLGGCLSATNGHVSSMALADPAGAALAKKLIALTP